MGLLKTKKMRTARITRRQVRHKKSGGSVGVSFKETDRGLVKVSKKTSNLRKVTQGVKKSLLGKGKDKKGLSTKQKVGEKKEQRKKQKEREEEEDELDEDDGQNDPNVENSYYFPQENVKGGEELC